MSNIIERIGEFIKAKDISIRAFELSIGASNGSIGRAIAKNKDIGISWLSIIIDKYPDLNTDWLLTGRGEIFATKIPENPYNENVGKFVGEKVGFPKLHKTPTITTYPEIEERMVPTASDVRLCHQFPLREDHPMEQQRVPLYDLAASAGLEALFIDPHELTPSSYIVLPDLPPCDGALHVWGDSMYPLLKSGDIVLYRQVRNIADGILWGEMYLVSITVDDDEMVAVKYIQKGKDDAHVRLVSQNEFYSPKEVPLTSIRGLALIKASVRYNTMG